MQATDPEGVGDELEPVLVGLRAEIRDKDSRGELEMRICKTRDTLSGDLDVYFEDWVTHNGRVVFDGTLAANGTCTVWGDLTGESAFDEGDGIGGEIRVVSPARCGSVWGRWCGTDPDPGCGSCWFINTGIMTRTCR